MVIRKPVQSVILGNCDLRKCLNLSDTDSKSRFIALKVIVKKEFILKNVMYFKTCAGKLINDIILHYQVDKFNIALSR